MRYKGVPMELTRQVQPRAIRSHAEGLGWRRVENVNGKVAVYHSPNDELRQLLVPLDPAFDDYGERIAEAIDTLARFEGRPNQEMLTQLLLPPADLLSLAPAGRLAASNVLPVSQVAELLAGIQRVLVAVAASVLQSRPCHEGRPPAEADQLAQACLLVQAEPGGPAVRVAVPLDAVVWPAHLLGKEPPFARAVCLALLETLDRLAQAADQARIEELLQPGRAPLLSANLCEALALLRPADPRGALAVSATWYVGLPLPAERSVPGTVVLRPEVFAAADHVARLLRLSNRSQPTWHVGFVQELRGAPGPDNRAAGEVRVAIVQGDEVVQARLDLPADDYALASTAHLNNSPVYFRGVLLAAPGPCRVEQVGPFLLVQRPLTQAS